MLFRCQLPPYYNFFFSPSHRAPGYSYSFFSSFATALSSAANLTTLTPHSRRRLPSSWMPPNSFHKTYNTELLPLSIPLAWWHSAAATGASGGVRSSAQRGKWLWRTVELYGEQHSRSSPLFCLLLLAKSFSSVLQERLYSMLCADDGGDCEDGAIIMCPLEGKERSW